LTTHPWVTIIIIILAERGIERGIGSTQVTFFFFVERQCGVVGAQVSSARLAQARAEARANEAEARLVAARGGEGGEERVKLMVDGVYITIGGQLEDGETYTGLEAMRVVRSALREAARVFSQGRHKGPEGASERLKGASEGPKGASEGPEGASKGSKGASRGLEGASEGWKGASRGLEGASEGSKGSSEGSKGAGEGPEGVSKGLKGASEGPERHTEGPEGGNLVPHEGVAEKVVVQQSTTLPEGGEVKAVGSDYLVGEVVSSEVNNVGATMVKEVISSSEIDAGTTTMIGGVVSSVDATVVGEQVIPHLHQDNEEKTRSNEFDNNSIY
jgi:hypothetical protein